MATPLWISNLTAYCLQIAVLAASGTLLAFVFRLRIPRVALLYWQILLIGCISLPLLQPWKHPTFAAATAYEAGVDIGSAVSEIAVPANHNQPPEMPWEALGLILAAGVFIRLLWIIVGFLRLRVFLRQAHMFLEDQAVVQDMQWRTGVRVSLLLSAKIESPVTFGFRSPIIILPLSFRSISEPSRGAILCHELLHVRRRDWILIVLEEFVRSVFWFHPAIWWLIGRIQLSREQAVDLEVVQLTGSKQPYLDSLLEFAQVLGRPKAIPAPLFLKEHHLVQRVNLLIKEASMSRVRLGVSILGISLLLLGAVYLSSGLFPLTGAPVLAQEKAGNSDPTAQKREPIKVGREIADSKLIRRVEPVYPDLALRARVQGLVILTATINEEGFVSGVKVVSGNPLLREAAIDAVKQWHYSPTLLNGEPVPVVATVTVVFSLKGDDGATVQDSMEAAAPKREPIRIGGNVAESKLIRRVEPIYPDLALRARVQGMVVLTVTINEEGFVSGLKVVSGNPLLREAAIDAVKQWHYSPTLLNGEPVPVVATVTVAFKLKGGDDGTVRNSTSEDPAGEVLQKRSVPGAETVMPMAGQYANPEQAPRRTSFIVNGDVLESKLIRRVNPVYPEEAKKERLEGIVCLTVTVNEEGFVSGIIAGPDNYEILENAAIEAVKQWRYSPTYRNGDAVPVTGAVTVVFQLKDLNDIVVSMDTSGNLSRDMLQLQKATGRIEIRVAPSTPYRVLADAVRDLMQNGADRVKLSQPFILFQGQVFYAGVPAYGQHSHDPDRDLSQLMNRAMSLARSSGKVEKGKPYRILYRVYQNEAGDVVGLQHLAGPRVPEIENELMRTRRIPVLLESNPVPYMSPFVLYFIG